MELTIPGIAFICLIAYCIKIEKDAYDRRITDLKNDYEYLKRKCDKLLEENHSLKEKYEKE